MSKLEAIEAEVRKLPREQIVKLQDWLADYLEEQGELKPDFVASIERVLSLRWRSDLSCLATAYTGAHNYGDIAETVETVKEPSQPRHPTKVGC